jgi:acyl-CoA thioester hydrolase
LPARQGAGAHWVELLDARMLGWSEDMNPDAAEPYAVPRIGISFAMPTRWEDNDSYGHVNNVTYYSYFDTAVNEHLIRVGGLDIRHGTEVGLVVETMCRYHKPLSFPDELDTGLRVVRLGNSSVTYEIGIFRRGDDAPAASGRFVHVWVDRATQRRCPCLEHSRGARTASCCRMSAQVAAATVRCAPMSALTRGAAQTLLAEFLRGDVHYGASSAVYGDGGDRALGEALDLFLARPEIGFVWLATAITDEGARAVGACVVCYAISTSRGTLVAKLDDVTVAANWQGRGVGGAMLDALASSCVGRGSRGSTPRVIATTPRPGASTSASAFDLSMKNASRCCYDRSAAHRRADSRRGRRQPFRQPAAQAVRGLERAAVAGVRDRAARCRRCARPDVRRARA